MNVTKEQLEKLLVSATYYSSKSQADYSDCGFLKVDVAKEMAKRRIKEFIENQVSEQYYYVYGGYSKQGRDIGYSIVRYDDEDSVVKEYVSFMKETDGDNIGNICFRVFKGLEMDVRAKSVKTEYEVVELKGIYG